MYHYKDKTPEKTIQIIKDFFNKHNIEIKEEKKFISECGTYSCGITLWYQGKEIQWTNGKGYTEILSLASGYAEAYERFCNGMSLKGIDPLFINEQYKEKSKNDSLMKNWFPYIPQEYIDLYNNSYYNRKYININDSNDLQNLNTFFLISLNGSSGMSAGNSLPEALNQGISELYEHYVLDKYSNLSKQEKKYSLDITYLIEIMPNYLSNILSKILSHKNYELYIYDFSYNYNVPVLMSCLINKDTHNIQICFGSFPVFEIALERVITELYQGIESFQCNNKYAEPYLDVDIKDYVEFFINPSGVDFINENLFFNLQKNVKPNKKVFLFDFEKKYNTLEIFTYYQQLSIKNKITFYYTDNSLSKDIYAVHIYAPNLPLHTKEKTTINNYPKIQKYYNLLLLKEKMKKNIIISQYFDLRLIYEIKEILDSFNILDLQFLRSNFYFSNEFYTYGKFVDSLIESFIDILSTPFFTKFLWNEYLILPFSQKIKDNCILYDYAISEKYNIYDKIEILNNILKYNVTIQDLEKIKNKEYFINHTFCIPMYNLYHSQEMKDFVNIFLNNKRD